MQTEKETKRALAGGFLLRKIDAYGEILSKIFMIFRQSYNFYAILKEKMRRQFSITPITPMKKARFAYFVAILFNGNGAFSVYYEY